MQHRGFTLIEILVVIGMLALLSTVVLVAINPLRQFAQARNTQREANVSAILNAVGQRLADNRGVFANESGDCSSELPTDPAPIAKSGTTHFDLRPCIVPTYISEIPTDPDSGENSCSADAACSTGSYATGYTIARDTETSRITVCAPLHEEEAIPGSTPFCLTR